MDERDLYRALAPSRRAAGLSFLKEAGVITDSAKGMVSKPQIIGALIGAGVLGASELMASRKNRDGKTLHQVVSERALQASNRLPEDGAAGLPSDLARVGAKLYKNMADAFAKHPAAATVMAAGAGASMGAKFGPFGREILRKVGV